MCMAIKKMPAAANAAAADKTMDRPPADHGYYLRSSSRPKEITSNGEAVSNNKKSLKKIVEKNTLSPPTPKRTAQKKTLQSDEASSRRSYAVLPSHEILYEDPPPKLDSFLHLTIITLTVALLLLLWSMELDIDLLTIKQRCWPVLRPLLGGLGVAVLTSLLIYFDSSVPGENPKPPLGGVGGGLKCHLAYLVAIINGIASAAVLALVND